MATLGNTYLGLIDLYKQQGGKGEIVSTIMEMLHQMNPFLAEMIFIQCNCKTKHKTTIRTGLPESTWRKFYEGVQPNKSTLKQVEDATGMLENWIETDEDLADISGNVPQFRLNELMAHLEGMNQDVAETMIYGSLANDSGSFLGLAPRFNDLTAENGNQIIDAGGQGSNNTSIWMIGWGENTVHGIYPEGTMAGLEHKDLGVETVNNPDGSRFRAYRDQLKWHCGISVRDWRYVTRIANIDVDAVASGDVDLYGFLRKSFYQNWGRRKIVGMNGSESAIPSIQPTILLNTDMLEALDALGTNAGASDNFVRLKPVEIQGQEVLTYRGIPLRETDALINTEERVV